MGKATPMRCSVSCTRRRKTTSIATRRTSCFPRGLLAEAEGEKEIWRNLRMRLFIDPVDIQARYEKSPVWLQSLMSAWADGLNYYLRMHPQVRPRVIEHFEPWMALTFSEGSIGGDIERILLTGLEAFYGGARRKAGNCEKRRAVAP